jgi:nucleoside-diphosphate-sugar epimerase
MNAEKVLILGSRGFFGKNFISKFNSQVFYNDNLNLENYNELFSCVDSIKPTVIINCAGVVGSSIGNIDDVEIFERNNKILHNVFSVCSKFKTKLVVFSTYRVFGDVEQYSESDVHLSEMKNNSGYLLSKKVLDYYIKVYSKQIKILCLFLTNAYGEYDLFGEQSRIIPASIFKIYNYNNVFVDCNEKTQVNLLYIDDMLKIVENFLTNNVYCNKIVFNTKNTITIKNLHELIMDKMNRSIDIKYNNSKQIVSANSPKNTNFEFDYTDMEYGLSKTIDFYMRLK